MEGAPPAILIGAVLGDSDLASMNWSRTIGALSERVERLSSGLATPLRLNVIYHVDGRVTPNEFEGVRTGQFDHAQSRLVVQAAVPAAVPPEEDEGILVGLLEAAVLEAEEWARRKRIADDLPALRSLVRGIAA